MKMGAMAMSRTMTPEMVLLDSAKRGNREALGELAKRHYQQMYRVALRIVHEPSDAEDVVQNVYMTMLRKIGEFRGESALSTWLTSITVNAAKTLLRKRKRPMISIEESQAEQLSEIQHALARDNMQPSPEEHVISVEVQNMMENGLCQLGPNYQIPMRLRMVDELSIGQIASTLDLPEGTVKVQLFRGRQAMRKHIASRLRAAA
jgi:RNA polymerase sigma-70 factor, ECF subfamily